MNSYIMLAVICLSATCDNAEVQTGEQYNSIKDCQSELVLVEQTIEPDNSVWIRLSCESLQPSEAITKQTKE